MDNLLAIATVSIILAWASHASFGIWWFLLCGARGVAVPQDSERITILATDEVESVIEVDTVPPTDIEVIVDET